MNEDKEKEIVKEIIGRVKRQSINAFMLTRTKETLHEKFNIEKNIEKEKERK